jgi:hypothetical protein
MGTMLFSGCVDIPAKLHSFIFRGHKHIWGGDHDGINPKGLGLGLATEYMYMFAGR